jgi:hypothetical protein
MLIVNFANTKLIIVIRTVITSIIVLINIILRYNVVSKACHP